MSEPLRPHRPFDAHSLHYHKGERCVSASAVCLSLEMHSVHRRLIAVAWHDGLVSGKLIVRRAEIDAAHWLAGTSPAYKELATAPFPRQTTLTSRFSRRPAEPRVSSLSGRALPAETPLRQQLATAVILHARGAICTCLGCQLLVSHPHFLSSSLALFLISTVSLAIFRHTYFVCLP